MRVMLGNTSPHHRGVLDAATGQRTFQPLPGPAVTTFEIPDDYTFNPNVELDDVVRHLYSAQATNGITHLEDNEALLVFLHWDGAWPHHSSDKPSWVSVTGPDAAKAATFEVKLAEFYGCAQGAPADVEETHFTASGPPTVTA